jgi:hypothetical protein
MQYKVIVGMLIATLVVLVFHNRGNVCKLQRSVGWLHAVNAEIVKACLVEDDGERRVRLTVLDEQLRGAVPDKAAASDDLPMSVGNVKATDGGSVEINQTVSVK